MENGCNDQRSATGSQHQDAIGLLHPRLIARSDRPELQNIRFIMARLNIQDAESAEIAQRRMSDLKTKTLFQQPVSEANPKLVAQHTFATLRRSRASPHNSVRISSTHTLRREGVHCSSRRTSFLVRFYRSYDPVDFIETFELARRRSRCRAVVVMCLEQCRPAVPAAAGAGGLLSREPPANHRRDSFTLTFEGVGHFSRPHGPRSTQG